MSNQRYKEILIEEAGSFEAFEAWKNLLTAAQTFAQKTDCLPGASTIEYAAAFLRRVERRYFGED